MKPPIQKFLPTSLSRLAYTAISSVFLGGVLGGLIDCDSSLILSKIIQWQSENNNSNKNLKKIVIVIVVQISNIFCQLNNVFQMWRELN
jgi:hypothetical protein